MRGSTFARLLGVAVLIASPNIALALAPALTAAFAEPQFKTTEKFGKPMSEAVALVKEREFRQAIGKVDQAAAFAKTQKEKLAVEQLRTAIFSGLGRTEALIKSLERQLAIGGLPAATIKDHRLTVAGLYDRQGNDAKAVSLTKAYIEDYGGTPDQYAFVASNALKNRDYVAASSYASKAISAVRSSGARKPKESWRRIVMRAEFQRGDLDGYYAAVEQTAMDYPKDEYFRILAERAAKEPSFNNTLNRLDIYRALSAAGVLLTSAERADMAERAYTRGLAADAAAMLAELQKANYSGIEKERVARLERMRVAAAADARGGLEKLVAAAGRDTTGRALVTLGEAYIAAGEPHRAIKTIEQALTGSTLSGAPADYARLQLGIAQLDAGQEEAARKTWSEIRATNGSGALARVWTLISRS